MIHCKSYCKQNNITTNIQFNGSKLNIHATYCGNFWLLGVRNINTCKEFVSNMLDMDIFVVFLLGCFLLAKSWLFDAYINIIYVWSIPHFSYHTRAANNLFLYFSIFLKRSFVLYSKFISTFPIIFFFTIVVTELINAWFLSQWNVIFHVGIQKIFNGIFVFSSVLFLWYLKILLNLLHAHECCNSSRVPV